MAVEFRCEKCGKLLSVEAQPGATVRCHHCRSKITVPAALASLPTPQIPGGQGRPATPPPPAQPEEDELLEVEAEEESPVIAGMAKVMPYAISLVLHVGLLVLFALLTVIVIDAAEENDMIHPDALLSEDPGGALNPGALDEVTEAQQDVTETIEQQWSQSESEVALDALNESENTMDMFGSAGGASGGSLAAMGLSAGGGESGPRASFMGSGGNAHHILYVVDHSGSMLETMDSVKLELGRSIRDLSPAQDFHVLFFNTGPPTEAPQRRLVPATPDYKREIGEFIRDVRAENRPGGGGVTDPIPTLERAMQIMANADTSNGRRFKLIYLLTDGEFADNDAVIELLRRSNRGDPPVAINTILHHYRPPVAERVLRTIAEQNSGQFRFVERR